MSERQNVNKRMDELIVRALNKIKKPGTVEEITELLNRELDPGDRPFDREEVEAWLRRDTRKVVRLYWLAVRPRR